MTNGEAGGGRIDPSNDRISNLPWRVTIDPDEEGWRRVTLVTQPVALSTHMPRCFLRAKFSKLSFTSQPEDTSMACAFSALALSLVMTIGGLGLFLDPTGLPRGLRMDSPSADFGNFGATSKLVASIPPLSTSEL